MPDERTENANNRTAERHNAWQKWWDRLTLIPIYLVMTAAVILDMTKDGDIDSHFVLLIWVATNTGLINVLRKIWGER
jgi:hypothetical protein